MKSFVNAQENLICLTLLVAMFDSRCENMATIADLARATRMVVHGGHDYMDEKAQYFCYGHPILSIEMGGRVRHFKCTSVDVMHSNKYARLQRNFYLLEDPSACQLDKTDKSIRKPNFIPAVD